MAENIVQITLLAALDQPGMFQFLLGKAAAAQIVEQAVKAVRRITEAEPADGRIGQAALLPPVGAGGGGLRRLGVELLIKIPGGAAVNFQKPLAGAGFLVILLRHGHPGAGGQLLDGLHIAQVVVFAHKGDGVPRRAAAKAIVALGLRIHHEGRRFFVVERAQSGGGAAAAAQLDILADQILNVVAPHHFLNVFLRDQGRTPFPVL